MVVEDLLCDTQEVEMNEYTELVYATANIVTELCSPKRKRKVNARKKPSWKQKMEKEIERLRGELSMLSELDSGINVKGKICRNSKRKYKLNEENRIRMKETVKQRIQLKARRIGKYEKREKFYGQNLIFINDSKKFYREIGKEKVTVNETSPINDIERFWDTTWSEEKDFNEEAEWIKNVQTDNANIQEQQWSDNSVEELQTALKSPINGSQQE